VTGSSTFYKQRLTIRRRHPVLAGPNVFPSSFDKRRPDFDDQGDGPSNERRSHDLLNTDDDFTATASWLRNVHVGSHWGRLLYPSSS